MKATTHLSRNGRRACQPDAPLNTADLTTHYKLCECRACLDAFAHAEAKKEARLVDVEGFAGWRTVRWDLTQKEIDEAKTKRLAKR